MANFNFNKVILGGRLTADPEMRQTQSGLPMVSFSIAVSRRFSRSQTQSQDQQAPQQPTADFFNAIAWRSTAEFIARYFRRGSSICVSGSLQTRNYTDQQGVKRYVTEVIVDEAHFVDSKGESGGQSQQGGQFQPAYGAPSQQFAPDNYTNPAFSSRADDAGQFEEMSNDDDLPF